MNENVGKVFNLIGGQSQTGGVPPTRKVNGKPLSSDIVLTASDVGAAESGHSHTAADVGARPTSWTPSAADVGAVPVVRKVNGKVLSADVTLNASDVGAASSGHIHTAAEVGALPIGGGTLTGDLRIKGSGNYGTKINLGDGDYVHFAEPIDDCLEIKAKKINFVTSDSTDQKFTLNCDPIGGVFKWGKIKSDTNSVGTGSPFVKKYIGNAAALLVCASINGVALTLPNVAGLSTAYMNPNINSYENSISANMLYSIAIEQPGTYEIIIDSFQSTETVDIDIFELQSE